MISVVSEGVKLHLNKYSIYTLCINAKHVTYIIFVCLLVKFDVSTF